MVISIDIQHTSSKGVWSKHVQEVSLLIHNFCEVNIHIFICIYKQSIFVSAYTSLWLNLIQFYSFIVNIESSTMTFLKVPFFRAQVYKNLKNNEFMKTISNKHYFLL